MLRFINTRSNRNTLGFRSSIGPMNFNNVHILNPVYKHSSLNIIASYSCVVKNFTKKPSEKNQLRKKEYTFIRFFYNA